MIFCSIIDIMIVLRSAIVGLLAVSSYKQALSGDDCQLAVSGLFSLMVCC